jgi:hypothetical protein
LPGFPSFFGGSSVVIATASSAVPMPGLALSGRFTFMRKPSARFVASFFPSAPV